MVLTVHAYVSDSYLLYPLELLIKTDWQFEAKWAFTYRNGYICLDDASWWWLAFDNINQMGLGNGVGQSEQAGWRREICQIYMSKKSGVISHGLIWKNRSALTCDKINQYADDFSTVLCRILAHSYWYFSTLNGEIRENTSLFRYICVCILDHF